MAGIPKYDDVMEQVRGGGALAWWSTDKHGHTALIYAPPGNINPNGHVAIIRLNGDIYTEPSASVRMMPMEDGRTHVEAKVTAMVLGGQYGSDIGHTLGAKQEARWRNPDSISKHLASALARTGKDWEQIPVQTNGFTPRKWGAGSMDPMDF
jgi:hypothetical protein